MQFKFRTTFILTIMLFLLTVGLIVLPVIARDSALPPALIAAQTTPKSLFEQGTYAYQSGQFTAAATAFQQAAQIYRTQGSTSKLAATLSNLTLAYQQLGLWPDAQKSIERSLELLNFLSSQPKSEAVKALAQALEIQGGLDLAMGRTDRAIDTWQQSEKLYVQLQDQAGLLRNQLNQAKAFQVKGLYRRALTMLEKLEQSLKPQPDSVTKVIALRSLGDTLQLTGDLAQSHRVLQTSLQIAQRLQSPEHISAAQFSLGNTARTSSDQGLAISFYQQAAMTAPTLLARLQAQINHFSLLKEPQQRPTAIALVS
jgi:tetratricopeptide (TPR) repeat protein